MLNFVEKSFYYLSVKILAKFRPHKKFVINIRWHKNIEWVILHDFPYFLEKLVMVFLIFKGNK